MLGHSIRHVSIYVGLGLNHLGLILLLYQCPLRERNNRALGCHTCLLSYLLKETLLPPFSSRITTKYAIWHLQSTGLSNTKSEVYGFEAPSTPLHSPQREKTHSLHTWFFFVALGDGNALQRLQRPLSFNMQHGRKRNSSVANAEKIFLTWRLKNRPPQPPCCSESLNMWTDRSFTGLEKWFAVLVLTSRTFPSITPLCTIILC